MSVGMDGSKPVCLVLLTDLTGMAPHSVRAAVSPAAPFTPHAPAGRGLPALPQCGW